MDWSDGPTGALSYVALKLVGYGVWGYVGLRWLSPGYPTPVRKALVLGALRLVLGWVTGILVGPFVLVTGTRGISVFYFSGLAIVRFVEWSIIGALLPPSGASATDRGFLGGGGRGLLWRVGGIIVSYLADLPFLIAEGGLPHGRILC